MVLFQPTLAPLQWQEPRAHLLVHLFPGLPPLLVVVSPHLLEVEPDWHSVHVSAPRGLGGVDVRMGVDPEDAGLGVDLQVSVEGGEADGVVAPEGQANSRVWRFGSYLKKIGKTILMLRSDG